MYIITDINKWYVWIKDVDNNVVNVYNFIKDRGRLKQVINEEFCIDSSLLDKTIKW